MPETRTYEELEMVAIPEAIPELGVEPGESGTVALVHEDDAGQLLLVHMDREDGATVGSVQLRVAADGAPRVVGYSSFEAS